MVPQNAPGRERQRQARASGSRTQLGIEHVAVRERGRIRVDVAPLGWIDQRSGAASPALPDVYRFVSAIA